MIQFTDTKVKEYAETHAEIIEIYSTLLDGRHSTATEVADFEGVDLFGIAEQVPGSGIILQVGRGYGLQVVVNQRIQGRRNRRLGAGGCIAACAKICGRCSLTFLATSPPSKPASIASSRSSMSPFCQIINLSILHCQMHIILVFYHRQFMYNGHLGMVLNSVRRQYM